MSCSFKLAWSPVVDSFYSLALGRRKSWVVPIQLASAVLWPVCRFGDHGLMQGDQGGSGSEEDVSGNSSNSESD